MKEKLFFVLMIAACILLVAGFVAIGFSYADAARAKAAKERQDGPRILRHLR